MAKYLTLILILHSRPSVELSRYFHMKVQLYLKQCPITSCPIFLSLSYKFIILPKPAPYLFYISLKSILSLISCPSQNLDYSLPLTLTPLPVQSNTKSSQSYQASISRMHPFPWVSPAQCSGHHLTAVTASEWSLCLLAYSPYNHRNFLLLFNPFSTDPKIT